MRLQKFAIGILALVVSLWCMAHVEDFDTAVGSDLLLFGFVLVFGVFCCLLGFSLLFETMIALLNKREADKAKENGR